MEGVRRDDKGDTLIYFSLAPVASIILQFILIQGSIKVYQRILCAPRLAL